MTVEEALPVVLAVANLADSPESIPKFKEWIVANGYGVYRVLEKDAEWLLGFRDQLRRVWWIAEQFSIGKNSDTHEVQKIGSEREFGKLCILRGFLKNQEFGLGRG